MILYACRGGVWLPGHRGNILVSWIDFGEASVGVCFVVGVAQRQRLLLDCFRAAATPPRRMGTPTKCMTRPGGKGGWGKIVHGQIGLLLCCWGQVRVGADHILLAGT